MDTIINTFTQPNKYMFFLFCGAYIWHIVDTANKDIAKEPWLGRLIDTFFIFTWPYIISLAYPF